MRKSVSVLQIVGLICFGLACLSYNANLFGQGPSTQKKSADAPTLFGRNLLKNGNAEASAPDQHKVPGGWQLMEEFTVATYGSVSGEWDWGLSGCADCGKSYVRLQFQDKKEIATSQTADIASSAEAVDAGKVSATIQAFLGGFLESDTTSVISASFLDSKGAELGSMETDPIDVAKLPKATSGSTGLSPCQKTGIVPAGTRSIVFAWKARATGDSNSYIALGDNFSLVLTKKD